MAEIRVMTKAPAGDKLGKQASTEIDEITESEIETQKSVRRNCNSTITIDSRD